MSRSTVSDILRVMQEINSLDRKGKLAILNGLLKQDLEPKRQEANAKPIDKTSTGARVPITYTEGGEK